MRHLVPISGKDSFAAALIQTTRYPGLPYEFFFNDTGQELPETYAWLREVETKTGWNILRIGADLERIIEGHGMLPSHHQRFCTRDAKIKPMERHFGRKDITVYYGLRADEGDRIAQRPSDQWLHVYPLADAGIDLRGVWLILKAQNLLPPAFFWPSLYYRVCELLGPRIGWIDELAEWEQRVLFAGRTRANCYFCFYQRQYEILWLAETHPDLLWRATWIERFAGKRRKEAYSFVKGFFFDEVVSRRQTILDRRAKEVCGIIEKRVNKGLFDEPSDTEIALTSCGLLCGK